jgi:hypothetical protein
MNRVGFRGFAKPAAISADLVNRKLQTMSSEGIFVLWTGNPYKARRASARSNSLATIKEVKKPVPLSTLIERAAKAHGETGYSPDIVRSGLFLHQGAKPAVYLALEKKEDGTFVAASNIPFPDPSFSTKPFKQGDVVNVEAPAAKAPAKPLPKAKTKAITNQ